MAILNIRQKRLLNIIIAVFLLFLFIHFMLVHNKIDPREAFRQKFLSTSNNKESGQVSQNDPRILEIIRSKYLVKPASRDVNYNLEHYQTRDPSMGQSDIVMKIFRNMKNGFFVECGALDGETRSNTLALERDFEWNGLLVEADPKNFKALLKKKRKAWLTNTCLSNTPEPKEVLFKPFFNRGKILDSAADAGEDKDFIRVQCFPLFSLLSALNVTQVDYFSLDVEGFELDVLKTIPFNSILIKVLSVEYIHAKEGENGPDGKDIMKNFMADRGYSVVSEVKGEMNRANDFIFAHKSILDSIPDDIPPYVYTLNKDKY